MPVYKTPDGRYTYAIETPHEADGNSVVYDHWRENPNAPGQPYVAWDRWSYEAELGDVELRPANPPSSPSQPPAPPPEPSMSAPASVRVIQVTDPSDGDFVPRMYSYWSNAWVNGRSAYVFAGHVDSLPRFFKIDLITAAVERLGSLVGFTGEAEGWYWNADGEIYLINGSRLLRVSPFTGEVRVVFDIAEMYPGCDLWQAHSSLDGRTHSATVRRIVSEGKYPYIATIVCRDGKLIPFPADGNLDESHISGNGRDVVIEENDDMRVINLDTRDTRKLRDIEGALAHIDCGPDFIVGEADKPDPGCCALYRLDRPLTPGNKVTLFLTTNMGHLSVQNNRCLLSDNTHVSLVSLNGGGVIQLFAHGGDIGGYDYQPKANLDPAARVACYMTHRDGRYDVYLAVLPA